MLYVMLSQGHYWAGRTPPPNNPPPNMAAANFVVMLTERGARLIEQPLPQCWLTNSVPRAFFSRIAIGCRLSLKIDRNLSPSWAGGGLSVATWYDTAWIGGTASGEYLYRSVVNIYFALPDLSSLSGRILMKLRIHIRDVSGHCWKIFKVRGQKSRLHVYRCVNAITAEAYNLSVW